MKKLFLRIAPLAFIVLASHGRIDSHPHPPGAQNIISAELGGLGVLYTLQYFRALPWNPLSFHQDMWVVLGFSAYPAFVTLPISFRSFWKIHSTDHRVEFGLGVVPEIHYGEGRIENINNTQNKSFSIAGAFVIGYRYFREKFTLHISLNVVFLFENAFPIPRLGVGGGLRF